MVETRMSYAFLLLVAIAVFAVIAMVVLFLIRRGKRVQRGFPVEPATSDDIRRSH
jgi:hypothetical protein